MFGLHICQQKVCLVGNVLISILIETCQWLAQWDLLHLAESKCLHGVITKRFLISGYRMCTRYHVNFLLSLCKALEKC